MFSSLQGKDERVKKVESESCNLKALVENIESISNPLTKMSNYQRITRELERLQTLKFKATLAQNSLAFRSSGSKALHSENAHEKLKHMDKL